MLKNETTVDAIRNKNMLTTTTDNERDRSLDRPFDPNRQRAINAAYTHQRRDSSMWGRKKLRSEKKHENDERFKQPSQLNSPRKKSSDQNSINKSRIIISKQKDR